MATMVIVSFGPKCCGGPGALLRRGSIESCDSGRKFSATTALGMTETMSGSRDARRTQFSLLELFSARSRKRSGYVPGMADADGMADVAQRKLEELVRENASSICEAKQAVVGENSIQSHSSCMEYRLVAEVAETGMAVYYLDLLADNDVAKDGEEGEDGRERSFAVDGPEGDIVDFEAIGEVANSFASLECVGDDDDFVATTDEFLFA